MFYWRAWRTDSSVKTLAVLLLQPEAGTLYTDVQSGNNAIALLAAAEDVPSGVKDAATATLGPAPGPLTRQSGCCVLTNVSLQTSSSIRAPVNAYALGYC